MKWRLKIGAFLVIAGGLFLFLLDFVGRVQVLIDIWAGFSKHFPIASAFLSHIFAHPWVVGLVVICIGILLLFVPQPKPEKIIVQVSGKKPEPSFSGWGPPKDGTFPATIQRGFYLTNHGDTALEVMLDRFKIGDKFAYGGTVSEIAGGKEGFILVSLEQTGVFFRFALQQALQNAWESKINQSEISYSQPLNIPVSVIYRDFENAWYRSECNLKYVRGAITFSAVQYTVLGNTRPDRFLKG